MTSELIIVEGLEMYHPNNMWFAGSPSQQHSQHHHGVKYQDVEHAGPPAAPLEFPTPVIHRVERSAVPVLDHINGRVYHDKEVITQAARLDHYGRPEHGYLLKKRLASCTYGVVRLAIVLEKNLKQEESRDCIEQVEWTSTNEVVAIKVLSAASIRQNLTRNSSNPLREIGALQYVGNYHPNVLGCIEVLQDEEELFIVMPYCPGRDLYGKLMGSEPARNSTWPHPVKPLRRPSERGARKWFSQLLQGLLHLQNKGISHCHLSLENLLLDGEGNLVIADFGFALRVPYTDWGNFGGVTDVSEGSLRRLIVSQGHGGNSAFLAPELIKRDAPFDGFAVDMWSAGVILFVFLVGRAPFRLAREGDTKFTQVAIQGQLRALLHSVHLGISENAADLLQNLLWADPRRRLSLQEALTHSWVTQDHDSDSDSSFYDETKNSKIVRFDPSSECKDLNCRLIGLGDDALSRLSLGRMASF